MSGQLEEAYNLRRQPAQTRSKETVERVVSATRQLLPRVGYDGLSMGVIADEAGVSKAGVYQYFPNKNAVVAVVVAEIMEELVLGFGAHLQEALGSDLVKNGPRLLAKVFDELDKHRPTLTAVLRSAPQLLPASAFAPISQRWGDATRTIVAMKVLPASHAAKTLPEVDAEALVAILSVCGPALCLHYLAHDVQDKRDPLARTFFSMAYGGLTAAGLET